MKGIIFSYLAIGGICTILTFAFILIMVLFFEVEIKTNKNKSKLSNVLFGFEIVIFTTILWPVVLYIIFFRKRKINK